MENAPQFLTAAWTYLNYPIIKLSQGEITAWNILSAMVGLAVVFIVLSFVKRTILRLLTAKKVENISNWRAVITLGYYVLICVGLVTVLQTSGLDLSMFAVLTGAVGIGIGFGMQTIVSNFVSGIILLLEKPLKLGDRVEVGQVDGNVLSIGVRATTIMTNDHTAIIVPNSDFISKTVVNWSYYGNVVRFGVTVRVAYDSDLRQVEAILLRVAETEQGVLNDPAPTVRLVEFGESAFKFMLMVWTHDFADRRGTLKSNLNFAIWEAFQRHNIRFPYPQMDVHMVDESEARERVTAPKRPSVSS